MALTQKKAMAMVKRVPGMTLNATRSLALLLVEIAKNPRSLKDKLVVAQQHLVEVSHPRQEASATGQDRPNSSPKPAI